MKTEEKIKIAAVVGPTASGKTALSIALAKRFHGEILSCDSMQIYREMDIGTAKPTPEEQEQINHHLINIAAPTDCFSVADYVSAAKAQTEQLVDSGKLPFFCGGTGLYLDAFLRDSGFSDTRVCDEVVCRELEAEAEENGGDWLHAQLAAVDPEAAASIHPNNRRRVIRALEIYRSTGKTKTEHDRESLTVESPYDATVIGLRFENRDLLRTRMDARVDAMMASGLLEETERLRAQGVFEKNGTAAQAIGYKELFGVLDGTETLANAVQALKFATHRYARRQMTWFTARPYVKWVTLDRAGCMRPVDEIIGEATALLEKNGIYLAKSTN